MPDLQLKRKNYCLPIFLTGWAFFSFIYSKKVQKARYNQTQLLYPLLQPYSFSVAFLLLDTEGAFPSNSQSPKTLCPSLSSKLLKPKFFVCLGMAAPGQLIQLIESFVSLSRSPSQQVHSLLPSTPNYRLALLIIFHY